MNGQIDPLLESTGTLPLPDEAFSEHALALQRRLRERQATIAVVGLGYVGLPLVRAMHAAGFTVLGFDRDRTKIDKLARGETYLQHLGSELTRELAGSKRFTATDNEQDLATADVVILCVPSPLGRHHEPDMSFIVETTEAVARVLHPGMLVCLESTTYPGTTRGECRPILEARGLECGVEFFLAFSPEREDPGRAHHHTATIPKLVGGTDPISTELARELYAAAVDEVVTVETAEVAEAAKILENVYRSVNIALVNELKHVFSSMGIDIWQVIEAAATKPFGFQPFYPGPGLGGHCIPIDPFYLTWKAKEFGHHTRFIELAGEINSAMPRHVVTRTIEALNTAGKPVNGARILICGIAYKPDVDDMRETPAAEIIEHLRQLGAEVSYHDPHVPRFPSMRKHDLEMASVALTPERLQRADCVLIVTDHKMINWRLIAAQAALIIDTRNAMSRHGPVNGTVVKA